ncbi:MAG: hypothetical protein K2X38_05300 [Gemmataceae bacterium]|nr:hypothetical protein [Gemmataceae bacterium]
MGRRVLNRKELRNDFDAAERRPEDETTTEEEVDEEEDDEEGDEEEAGDEEAEEGEEAEGSGDEDEEEDEDGEPKPKKKKKKVVKEVKPKAKPRKSAKIVRMRVIWGVFNNSSQMVATYDYPKREEADAHAARLTADKKSTHFVQPVKEPIEEPKEK